MERIEGPARILICGINYWPESTGIAPYTTQMAEGLAERGHDVRVSVGVPHYPQWRRWNAWAEKQPLSERADEMAVRVRRHWHPVPKEGRLLPRLMMELHFGLSASFSILRSRRRDDLLIAVSPAMISSLIVLFMNRLFKKSRSAVWVQDIYSNAASEVGAIGSLATRAVRSLEGVMMRTADMVYVIDPRFVDVVAQFGVRPGAVRVLRNWGHLGKPDSRLVEEFRGKLSVDNSRKIVLHTGNMGKKQALDLVIEAARLADEGQSKVHFVLVGDGSERKKLEEMSVGIERVSILNPVENEAYASLLAASDVLLVNEAKGMRETALPSKLTAYFKAAKPVLGATETGSITHDMLQRSGAAVIVPPGSPEEILSGAERLLADPVQLGVLSSAGSDFSNRASGLADALNVVELALKSKAR